MVSFYKISEKKEKAELILKPPNWFEPVNPEFGIQYLNH